MVKYRSFKNSKRKIQNIFDVSQTNESSINLLDSYDIISHTQTNLKSYISQDIDTTFSFFDLYDFTGVTQTTVAENAEPANLYEFDGENYNFIYPVFGFPVPVGENPSTSPGGNWEFTDTTVGIIKTKIFFNNLTEEFITNSRIISFLYLDDESITIPQLRKLVDPVKDIYAEYNIFHRWIQKEAGFELEYYAFLPYPNTVEIKLDAKVIFYNFGELNALQNNKIENR